MLGGISQAFQSTGGSLQKSVGSLDDSWKGSSGTAAADQGHQGDRQRRRGRCPVRGLAREPGPSGHQVQQARARLIAIITEFQATMAAIGPNIIFPWGWAAAIAAANKAIAMTAEVMTELQGSLGAEAAEGDGGRRAGGGHRRPADGRLPHGGHAFTADVHGDQGRAGGYPGRHRGGVRGKSSRREADRSRGRCGRRSRCAAGAGAGAGGGGGGGGGRRRGAGTPASRSMSASPMVQAESATAATQSAAARRRAREQAAAA